MRISDWSSDVCSSDLMALRDGPSVYFYILIVITGFSYTPALVLWAGFCSAAAWVAGGIYLAGLPDTLVTVEDLLPDAAAYLAVRLDPYYVDLYRVGQDARSEEHTSELQSLMRISYAVFCLKKKNKT